MSRYDPVRRATHLLMRVVPDWTTRPGSVDYWDRVTSGNDARTALSIAIGTPLDRIHPARGNFTTDAEYRGEPAPFEVIR